MSPINSVYDSANAEQGSERHTNGQMLAPVAPSIPLVPDETTRMVLPADPGSTEAAAANVVSGKRQRKPSARAAAQLEAANQARARTKPTPRLPRESNKVVKRASQNDDTAKASPAPRSPAKKRASPRARRSRRATEPDYDQLMKDPVISPEDLAAAFPDAPDSAARVRMLGQVREASGMAAESRAELAFKRYQQQEKEQKAKKLAKELAFREAEESSLENDQESQAAWILVALSNSSPEPPSTPGTPATSEATILNEREVSPPPTSARCTPLPLPEEEPRGTHRRLDSVINGRQLAGQELAGSSSLPLVSAEHSTHP
ncbi:hypothetical protein AC578_860 [Pseudocercospora eumusae]|uniref:Uncharacterized protein n=1 Tax=Pseudocercospora eumusae TaxID=321146 RepID=A0A139H433_9PEZI|nr:hypothetical protein AC578_860 [Pseudocercospora eumusae]